MKEVTANYDESWKEALTEYFESFLTFFFPQVHQLIDWTKTPCSLDKELQEITASSKTEKRIADRLYQVWLLDKQEVWIWILIRGLYDRCLTKEQIVKLFKIVDKMMTLPEQLQRKLVDKINSFEEERKMPLISPTEELAMERGKEIGALGKARDSTKLPHTSLTSIAISFLVMNLSTLLSWLFWRFFCQFFRITSFFPWTISEINDLVKFRQQNLIFISA